MKHITKLADRQYITIENTSYIDRHGMKQNGNNLYTILPIQAAMDHSYQQQMLRLEEWQRWQQAQVLLAQNTENTPCAPLEGAVCPPSGLDRVPAPPRDVGADLGRCRGTKWGPRRSPAQRVRRGEEEQWNERVFARLGGNEGYGACDDEKQDKGKASSATPFAGHIYPQCGQFQGFPWALEMGSKSERKQSSALVIPQRLLPQEQNRGQAPERSCL